MARRKQFGSPAGSATMVLHDVKKRSGRQLERLIGHITFACLLRRPLLCCLRSAYDFVGVRSDVVRQLWPSALRELRMALGLLIYAHMDLAAPWYSNISAFDAAPSGHASVFWPGHLNANRPAGRWQDKMRLKEDLGGHTSRSRALLRAASEDIAGPRSVVAALSDSHAPVELNARFPEIESSVWRADNTSIVHYAPLRHPEHIHLKEMRGYTRLVRHLASGCWLFGGIAAWCRVTTCV